MSHSATEKFRFASSKLDCGRLVPVIQNTCRSRDQGIRRVISHVFLPFNPFVSTNR